MEKKPSTDNPIKLSVNDIFPSFNELNPNQEEMFLIFQGLNTFFALKEILNTHKIIELENNNQSSFLISLIKSNNIIATGLVNIKQGEQWITLNYENKKKASSNLALNLIDCIKLKIFCDIKNKNQNNTTFNNINLNNSALNINTNLNFTNKNNINKIKQGINQINLKISKRNINNKIITKGSPLKTNYDKISSRRSPNKDIKCNFNGLKMPNNEDILNNNLIKSNNFNTFNYMNVNINMNPYTTISKCSIKKIDLNSSNKTRNSKIAKKKSINDNNYTSLCETNKNFGIKKMNTSTCSLNTINNKNNHKKARLTPDIDIKEFKNTKNIGGSPGPAYERKKKIDGNIYDKYDNLDKFNDKTFNLATKANNFNNKESNREAHSNHKKEGINPITINKKNSKKMTFSNNIINTNINTNNINNKNAIINKVKNTKYPNDKCKNINDNNNFNNTFNGINKQVIKSKLLYPSKQNLTNNNNNLYNNNICNTNNNHSTYFPKKNNIKERSQNLSYEEEKNKTKENSKVKEKEKIGIYTTKRIEKKNNVKIVNGKLEKNHIKNDDELGIIEKLEINNNINNNNIINNNNNNNNNINNNSNKNELNEEVKEIKVDENNKNDDIKNNENINMENFEDDKDYEIEYEYEDYTRMKEDFILMYQDDYVNTIQDDLLKLEVELFIEKTIELISCYHLQLEKMTIENELLQNDYILNTSNFKKIQKLLKKLELLKVDYEIKNFNKTKSKNSLNKQNEFNLIINKTEMEFFRNILLQEKENKENINKLKEIMLHILRKEENRNILSNDDNFNLWAAKYNNKKEKEKDKKRNKPKVIPNQQKMQINTNMTESSFTIEKSNNCLKNNNSFFNLDNTYKKKMPISPVYPKNNKFIPSSEINNNRHSKA